MGIRAPTSADACKKAVRSAALGKDENEEVFGRPELPFLKFRDLKGEAL